MELSRPNETNQHTETFSAAQIKYVKNVLKNLHIEDVEVSEETITSLPLTLEEFPTLGFTGLYDIPIAILASSKDKSPQEANANVIVIAPTPNGSGLFQDQETGKFLSNSFWMNDQGVLKFVQLEQPVYLDGLNNMYGHNPEVTIDRNITETLDTLIGDKQKTRKLLASHNISIPRGIFIEADESIQSREAKLNDFIQHNPDIKGLVFKELTGAHGDGVALFDMDEQDYLWNLMDMQAMGQEASIIEERIVPQQLSELQQYLPENQKGNTIDYNFRVLVTLDSQNAQVLDSEIRMRGNDNYPVNITLNKDTAIPDTQASLVEGIIDPQIIQDIYELSVAAAQVIAQNADFSEDTSCRYLGIDIMIDENGKPYILEINDGPVGGFGTLARIQHSTLQTISERYIPYIAEKLKVSHSQRPQQLPDNLSEIEQSLTDKKILLNLYSQAEDYTHAHEILIELEENLDVEFFIHSLIRFAYKTGEYIFARTYIDNELIRNPHSLNVLQADTYLRSLMNTDQPAHAESVIV